jgi:hypothetical protein
MDLFGTDDQISRNQTGFGLLALMRAAGCRLLAIGQTVRTADRQYKNAPADFCEGVSVLKATMRGASLWRSYTLDRRTPSMTGWLCLSHKGALGARRHQNR